MIWQDLVSVALFKRSCEKRKQNFYFNRKKREKKKKKIKQKLERRNTKLVMQNFITRTISERSSRTNFQLQ